MGEIVNWGIEREQEEEEERGEEDLIPRHEINPSHFPITLTVIHSCPNPDLNPTHRHASNLCRCFNLDGLDYSAVVS